MFIYKKINMNIRINKVLYKISLLGFVLGVLALYYSITVLKKYLLVKEVEKNGYLVNGILLKKNCESRGRSYGLISLPSLGNLQKLSITNCEKLEVGDTMSFKFSSYSKAIFQNDNGNLYFGQHHLFSMIFGIICSLFVFYISFHKSENLTKQEKYLLRNKKILKRKREVKEIK
jgi:hypothetical protein